MFSVSVLPGIETFCADSMDRQNKPRQRKVVYGPVFKQADFAGGIVPRALARARFNGQGSPDIQQGL